ncbi:MAG: HIT family protein [Deltaproteobacteria bacterium]|jgi:diadenosine tetraphosphate (Ap4A) HIT family hydrolase|nr:HIT family protein [Deltaproteobacteria bacterium]
MNTNETSECLFCRYDNALYIHENSLAFAIADTFPLTQGHTLILPKRHIESLFDASPDEIQALFSLINAARNQLDNQCRPDGFNVGVNDGTAAGQTLMHLHVHLIPRYQGDKEDPRGGMRWIMPDKADYWSP